MFGYNYEVLVVFDIQSRKLLTIIATRVTWNEICNIPDNIVYHNPAVLLFTMLFDLLHCDKAS
jgi:hypothetical protein